LPFSIKTVCKRWQNRLLYHSIVLYETGKIVWDTTRPNGQPRRRLDTSRAHQLLGFRARMGLEEGLRQTIAWYVAQQPG